MITPLFALLAAAQVSPATPPLLPRHESERACWGGISWLYFEPRTDRLDQHSQKRLTDFARAARESGEAGHFEVEASAPGDGPNFDRSLALRRATSMKRLLQQEGFSDFDIEVRLQSFFGTVSLRDEPSEARDEYERQAQIRYFVRQASELLPGGPVRECW